MRANPVLTSRLAAQSSPLLKMSLLAFTSQFCATYFAPSVRTSRERECVCVCVCLCVSEREEEEDEIREKRERDIH